MLFNSISFLVYFPFVVFFYFVLPQRWKKLWLLIMSYYFYMSWNVKYGFLILLSTIITYLCGRFIDHAKSNTWRMIGLICCLASNLGILFFFKYFTWLFEMFVSIMGSETSLPFSIVLPVGISFYTFQALGYTIDIYRKEIKAEKNFITYALFVSFFPQLVAGPIERSKNLLIQLQTPTEFDASNATQGLRFMLWGYVEKLVIADNVAIIVDNVYANWQKTGGAVLALATILHAIQVYCDFGGYSHIAIGAARVLNIKLMRNFEQPFFADSIKSLWRRWHISLSGWFRDYVYIPLGGNRKGKTRKYINIMITFLLSGLWHGAGMHYVVWGGLNGLYQVIGEILTPVRDKIVKILHINRKSHVHKCAKVVVTFLLFSFSIIFFRSNSIVDGVAICKKIVLEPNFREISHGLQGLMGINLAQAIIIGMGLVMLCVVDGIHEMGYHITTWLDTKQRYFRWGIYYSLILVVLISVVQTFGQNASAFLYFQF